MDSPSCKDENRFACEYRASACYYPPDGWSTTEKDCASRRRMSVSKFDCVFIARVRSYSSVHEGTQPYIIEDRAGRDQPVDLRLTSYDVTLKARVKERNTSVKY